MCNCTATTTAMTNPCETPQNTTEHLPEASPQPTTPTSLLGQLPYAVPVWAWWVLNISLASLLQVFCGLVVWPLLQELPYLLQRKVEFFFSIKTPHFFETTTEFLATLWLHGWVCGS